jgi:hypothetical protein
MFFEIISRASRLPGLPRIQRMPRVISGGTIARNDGHDRSPVM